MARASRILLIFVALISGGPPLHAAGLVEDRTYLVAEKAFGIGSWQFAENKFAQFVQKYPRSPRVAEAILYEAKARYFQNNFAGTTSLLATNRSRAGMWEDEYLYWQAEAEARMTNYHAAAKAFAELSRDFTNSPRRLEATVAEATALSHLGQWAQVTSLLEKPAGIFREAAASEPTNTFVVRGYLLLGEAQLILKNIDGVHAALEFLGKANLDPRLAWRRDYLRCRLQMTEGLPAAALTTTTNLLSLADKLVQAETGTNATVPSPVTTPVPEIPAANLLAESWSVRAKVFEALGRLDDAISAYRNNLTNAPVALERHAIFKIADLYRAQTNYPGAAAVLEDYLKEHAGSPASDMALLAMGELKLEEYDTKQKTAGAAPSTGALTNLIAQALTQFDRLLTNYPHSPLVGKARLDKGWCLWTEGHYARSLPLFEQAAKQLPFSQDQAAARFKWADAQFSLHDYAGAVSNYTFVATNYTALPDMDPHLVERALYQTVRAALPNNLSAATNAMRKIREQFPHGFAAPHCYLLLGQSLARRRDFVGARKLFADFEKAYPTNALLPEVRLAEARSYEQERKWLDAASAYDRWIRRFTNHVHLVQLPRAEFARAWDEYMAGQSTNAFMLFTNFITRFPTNELAQQAQWWVADHYFSLKQFHDAEFNYKGIYQNTNWPVSKLSYNAQMMAGRAAMESYGYKDAFGYFTNLFYNLNCPRDLRIQASFAAGDALLSGIDPNSTNHTTDVLEAVSWFKSIPRTYPTNQVALLAWGRIGDCYLQLADSDPRYYGDASNAYQRVVNSPLAPIAARSQARIGLGLIAEGLAASKSGPQQAALRQQALEDYLDVFTGENAVQTGKLAPFWVKKAGLEAGRVAESLQQWDQAIKIYQELENWLPVLRPTLDRKISNARKKLAGEKMPGPFDSANRGD